jgi:hypothetical protein
MKKFSLMVFASVLAFGLIFVNACGFAGFNNFNNGIQGSGTAKSETRNVSGFSKINAGGAIHMEISSGKDFAATLEADDNLLEHIKTDVSGDTLKIYTQDRISPKTNINIKISMPELKGLDVSGASSANVSNAKTETLELEASGASKIKLDGEAITFKSNASGASRIDAENLRVENAEVEASGASSTTVSPSGELKANASGASNIYYTGEPKNVVKNASGASSVKKK